MISAATRRLVRRRAGGRCEYCRIPEDVLTSFRFHVEHVRARQHRGIDKPSNLALACPDCNACKGPNLSGVDSLTDQIVPLFNPREHDWDDHFEKQEGLIIGLTPAGRATAEVLQFNRDERTELREQLAEIGEW